MYYVYLQCFTVVVTNWEHRSLSLQVCSQLWIHLHFMHKICLKFKPSRFFSWTQIHFFPKTAIKWIGSMVAEVCTVASQFYILWLNVIIFNVHPSILFYLRVARRLELQRVLGLNALKAGMVVSLCWACARMATCPRALPFPCTLPFAPWHVALAPSNGWINGLPLNIITFSHYILVDS